MQAPTKFELIVNLKTAKALVPHCLDAPTSCRIEMPFAAAHESVHGPSRQFGAAQQFDRFRSGPDIKWQPGPIGSVANDPIQKSSGLFFCHAHIAAHIQQI